MLAPNRKRLSFGEAETTALYRTWLTPLLSSRSSFERRCDVSVLPRPTIVVTGPSPSWIRRTTCADSALAADVTASAARSEEEMTAKRRMRPPVAERTACQPIGPGRVVT